MRTAIDLNCDLGEGCAHDLELMPWISSASIACGLHAGDARSMRDTVRACLRHEVAIGAHPSFPDRTHFGRRELALADDDLRATLRYQLGALQAIAQAEGGRLQHVKPHGALYNLSARDVHTAALIAEVVRGFDPTLALVGLAGSASIEAAREAGLVAVEEAFAERRYQADASLCPRSEPDACIESIEEAVAQARQLLREGTVNARDGRRVPIHADTLCLHGDRDDVVALAARLRRALEADGIRIRRVGSAA